MATTNPSQLLLLADHIKLSLLERQRAISFNLDPNSLDGQISPSLDSLKAGIQQLESHASAWDDPLNPSEEQQNTADHLARIKEQYADLSSQFYGHSNPGVSSTATQPNDASLAADFTTPQKTTKLSKSVRFTDGPSSSTYSQTPTPSRYAPYHDEPDEAAPDHSALDNQQIHEYHKNVISEQDEHLDRLGQSIGRQRELSIQIGDELDSQVDLLEEVGERTDRHQRQLDGASKRLTTFARKAKENWSLTTIVILIIILVLLIIITKR
ncbi:Calcium-channel protein [Venturia nashicola]|uniref:Calcium-channel protein n=1 Tax=Venturia nashicola TaxID=86259 RepID=A0A4Z1P370_9PEZI|nr:Calcium-channel protein [Venturia nashicola]TLD34917.1 Calcium-channel protein [Venturia nashicola]